MALNSNVIEFKLIGKENVSGAFDRAGGSMKRAAAVARVAATAIAATATAITAAVAGAYKFTTAHATAQDAVGKFADRLGTTSDVLSKFHGAALLGGQSTRQMELAIQRFNRRIGDSLKGLGEATKHFDNLGLSALELANMPLEERMYKFADALQAVENPAQRLSFAVGLLESEGAGFLQTIKNGSQSLKDVAVDMERLGMVISPQAAANAAVYTQEIGRFHMAMTGLGRAISDELNPALGQLAKVSANIVASWRDDIKEFTKISVIEILTAYIYIKDVLENIYEVATLSFDWRAQLKQTSSDINSFGQNIFDIASQWMQELSAVLYHGLIGFGDSVLAILSTLWNNIKSLTSGEEGSWRPFAFLAEELKMISDKALRDLEGSLREIELTFDDVGEGSKKLTLPLAMGIGRAREEAEKLYEALMKVGTAATENSGGVVPPPGVGGVDGKGKDEKDCPDITDQLETQTNQYATFYEAIAAYAESFADRVGNIYAQLGAETFSLLMGTANAAGQAFASVITSSKSLGEAMSNLFKQTLAQGVAMLVRIGVQRLILKVLNVAASQTESVKNTATGLKAVYLNSFASAAAIPIYGWAMAPEVAMANLGIATAGAAAASGAGAALSGAAHGGLENVPKESTYLLDKGERVLSPNQNKEFTRIMGLIPEAINQIKTPDVTHNITVPDVTHNITVPDVTNNITVPNVVNNVTIPRIAQHVPNFHNGVGYVPREGIYSLDKGERVIPAAQNKQLISDQQNTNVVINKIEILPNATSAQSLLDMDSRDLERVVADKLYDAFERLANQGIKMRGVP